MTAKQHKPQHVDPELEMSTRAAVGFDMDAAIDARATGHTSPGDDIAVGARVSSELGDVREAYAALIRARSAGVDDLYAELQKQDPPREPALWKQILKAAAIGALSEVTGGIVAGLAGRGLHHLAPGEHELVSSAISGGTAKAVETVAEAAFAGAEADAAKDGSHLHLDNAFKRLQQDALAQILHDSRRGFDELDASTAAKPQPTRLVALEASLDKAAKTAREAQHVRSFMAWTTVLAQSDRTIRGESKRDDSRTATGATNLGSIVNAEGIWVDRSLPTVRGPFDPPATSPQIATGVSHADGVLELHLHRIHTGNQDHFTVKSAKLPGFGSDIARNRINDIAIRDLQVPIVAWYGDDHDPAEKGFVVGRNEHGEYFANHHDSSSYDRLQAAHGDVAKYLFEHELTNMTLGKVVG